MAASGKSKLKTVCVNRRARHDYEVVHAFEAGLVLTGPEVKALREGKGNLVDAYATVKDGVPLLVNLEISPYTYDQTGASAPRRTRTMLLKGYEIQRLVAELRDSGLTLVPLSIYFKGPWAKVEVAVARGRKKADKRQALRAKEDRRTIERETRRR